MKYLVETFPKLIVQLWHRPRSRNEPEKIVAWLQDLSHTYCTSRHGGSVDRSFVVVVVSAMITSSAKITSAVPKLDSQ